MPANQQPSQQPSQQFYRHEQTAEIFVADRDEHGVITGIAGPIAISDIRQTRLGRYQTDQDAVHMRYIDQLTPVSYEEIRDWWRLIKAQTNRDVPWSNVRQGDTIALEPMPPAPDLPFGISDSLPTTFRILPVVVRTGCLNQVIASLKDWLKADIFSYEFHDNHYSLRIRPYRFILPNPEEITTSDHDEVTS